MRLSAPQSAANRNFHFARILSHELQECYRLRYEVYCNQARFLRVEDYPDQLERDDYDDMAIHVGAWNAHGELVGTARLVRSPRLHLPMFQRCDPNQLDLPMLCNPETIAEVSRLCISKTLTRHAPQVKVDIDPKHPEFPSTGAPGPEVVAGIFRQLYVESRKAGLGHWIAAMERSLLRMLKRFEIYFEVAGPRFDYHGEVLPCKLSMAAFEEHIAAQDSSIARSYIEALPDRLRPPAGVLRAGGEYIPKRA